MKAIFMTEIGGRLMEVERREIRPSLTYSRVVHTPVEMKAITGNETPPFAISKAEKWVCHSKPVSKDDFAVFLFDRYE